ncbi:bifunctional pyr operon transcriptional regulator/uracil phosphoribosyltransferase PyrR [Propionicicella superfundia]|uniref:bifunctional pyr operon transcriptional regulator/uracil phosphoribosyltransferase PyrR n=1 Tax=Propionicicella superfundia TaxID=348582 RepID=UPI0004197087|nr:bifunctional pyr operon transcriptional regulator/uracil phosphoribosyltransferase PyrR [Propionicicella superfundia]
MTEGPAGAAVEVLNEDEISRALARIAHQILEDNRGADRLIVLGIRTRGVPLARRIVGLLNEIEGADVPVGELDITMYRDDLRAHPTREVRQTRVPVSIDDAVVVLVDDVLYSGRTVVAAIDALRDLGRPRVVQLAVLVDRGHREVPIQADHVGKTVPTSRDERVHVHLEESDGYDRVTIERRATA